MKKLLNAITAPFTAIAGLVDESRNLNEDGSWDTYGAKKNCKAELRELRDTYRKNKTEIKNKWRIEK